MVPARGVSCHGAAAAARPGCGPRCTCAFHYSASEPPRVGLDNRHLLHVKLHKVSCRRIFAVSETTPERSTFTEALEDLGTGGGAGSPTAGSPAALRGRGMAAILASHCCSAVAAPSGHGSAARAARSEPSHL